MRYVPFEPPVVTGARCPECGGFGLVPGLRYIMDLGTGDGLLVDVFCPACGGCGAAAHDACTVPHAWAADDEQDLLDEDEHAGSDEVCMSCRGREWNAVLGFPPADDDENEDEDEDEDLFDFIDDVMEDLEAYLEPDQRRAEAEAARRMASAVRHMRVPCGCTESRVQVLEEIEL